MDEKGQFLDVTVIQIRLLVNEDEDVFKRKTTWLNRQKQNLNLR